MDRALRRGASAGGVPTYTGRGPTGCTQPEPAREAPLVTPAPCDASVPVGV